MGTLHDKEGWEGCPAQDPGHPDPWMRWHIPMGCPMLVERDPAGRAGKVSAIPWERGMRVCWSREGASCHGGGIWGVMEPPLWDQSVLGAGEQILRCCQGLEEQGRALGALPGIQCRHWGDTGDCAGSAEPVLFPKLCYRRYFQNPLLYRVIRGL